MGTLPARRAALSSLVAVAAAVALVLGVLTATTASRAAGFDPAESWTWSADEPLLPSGTAKAARVESLPEGRVAALMVVAGTPYGQPTGDVLVTRVRAASGTWGTPEVVWLGAEVPATRTFDSFADSAGRIVVVWAVPGDAPGRWPVRSVSRSTEGAWGTPEELYVARTDPALSDSLEIGGITPRLVPAGDTVTLAWATVVNASTSRIPVADNPFRARRWTAGTWGSAVTSTGYGAEAFDVQPFSPDSVQVWGNPSQAARPSDGRISFVYSLNKQRVTHSMDHPLSDGFTGPNAANEWDGVAERPWHASSTTGWVIHLDPGQGWSTPAKLVTHSGPPVVCASVDLPDNPPLAAHWADWKAFSQSPGISTSCPGEHSRTRSSTYDDDGRLRIDLDYRSDPTAAIVLNQFLDRPCDDPGASNINRFCFDDWGSTNWGISWSTASISIAPDAQRPAGGAVSQDPWPADRSTRVSTTSGPVTVHEQADGGDAIRFERAGGDVIWRPDPADDSALRVARVFAHGDDVAVFYYRASATSTPGCGMAVLRGGTTTVDGPSLGCLAPVAAHREDIIQLPNGQLVWINGESARSPVRVYGPTTEPTPTDPTGSTTDPSPSSPSPSPPAPSVPAPSVPAPVPPATTFTATKQPQVTGKLKVGKTLTARPGTWVPAPTGVSYRWMANGQAIAKATKAKLRLTTRLTGKRISLQITLTRAGVTATTRTIKARGRVR